MASPVRTSARRSPQWRWAAPLGAVALVAAGVGVSAGTAQADPGLPPRSAEQLVTDVLQAKVPGLSGTVSTTSRLGLPDLSGLGQGSGGGHSDFVTSLLTGTHSYRVWLAGPDKARVAIPQGSDETDFIANGATTWVWSSADQTAVRTTVPANKHAAPSTTAQESTPQQIAQQLLGQVRQDSTVSTTSASTVAGRSAYELVVTPKQTGTKIGRIEIAVDGTTHLPLRLEVFARGAASPALQVGFTSIDYAVPAAKTFTFTPPPGAKVTEHQVKAEASPTGHKPSGTAPTVTGTGWEQVLVAKTGESGATSDGTVGQLLGRLPVVSGSWGSGHLLDGSLFSVVVTNDGRVAVGAVAPSLLYAALSR